MTDLTCDYLQFPTYNLYYTSKKTRLWERSLAGRQHQD